MLSLSRNVLLLLFLYFIQGLPYGFQSQFLPLHLRSLGYDLTNVSLMRLLHAPWLCKAIWAPLVDRFGTKRKWLLGSISGLVVTCLIGSFISTENLGLLCGVLFLLNLFASTQDIAVDGIAVALLGSHELGSGNTAQVVGYKIGSIFGGGVLIWFMDQLGWFGLFMALTVLYIEAFMFVFVSPSLRYLEGRLAEINELNQRISDWQNQHSGQQVPEWEDYNVENEQVDGETCEETEDTQDDSVAEEHGEDSQSNSVDGEGDKSEVNQNDDDEMSDSRGDQANDANNGSKLEGQNEEGEEASISNGEAKKSVDEEKEEDLKPCEENAQNKDLRHRTNAMHGDKDSAPEAAAATSDGETRAEEDGQEAERDYLTAADVQDKSKFSLLKSVMSVPGTKWMMIFVLIYKLGEQGALGMLPMYLIDQHVSTGEVGFWTGVVGQGVSIFGSLMGGWLISNHKLPVEFLLQQFCLLRLLPLGVQLLLVVAWSMDIVSNELLVYPAMGTLMVLLLLSGMVTTATFTFMMQCSRLAPPSLQATHYTTLATLEVFGKLLFMTLAGWLVDRLGYPFMFLVFALLTLFSVLWFRKCPQEFLSEQETFSEDSEYQWETVDTKEKFD